MSFYVEIKLIGDNSLIPIGDGFEIINTKCYGKILTLLDDEKLIIPRKQYYDVRSINIYLEGELKSAMIIDDFESYNNSNQLRAVWKTSTTYVTLDLVILTSKMMKIQLQRSLAKDTLIYRKYTSPLNISEYDGIKLKFYQSNLDSKLSIYLKDAQRRLQGDILITKEQTFEEIFFWFDQLTQIGTGNFNFKDIREIGFVVTYAMGNTFMYIDDLVLINKYNDLEISIGLYDYNTNIFNSVKDGQYLLKAGGNYYQLDIESVSDTEWTHTRIWKKPGSLNCLVYGFPLYTNSEVYKITANNEIIDIKHNVYLQYKIKKSLSRKLRRIEIYADTDKIFDRDIIRIFYNLHNEMVMLAEKVATGNSCIFEFSEGIDIFDNLIFINVERKSAIDKIYCVIDW